MTSTDAVPSTAVKPAEIKEKIILLTKEPFSFRRIGAHLKQEVSRLFSQPEPSQRIADGLARGLRSLGYPVAIDPSPSSLAGTVAVIGNQEALRTALKAKQENKVHRLLAGPAVVESPDIGDRVIAHPDINRVLVTSEWVREWWENFDQYLGNKIEIWTPGVKDEGIKRDINGICLVYAKNADEKLFRSIMESLWDHNLVIMVSHFGSFQEAEYAKLLKKTKFVLYLTDFETDGHVLRQAWMADIPTLVLNSGSFEYQGKSYQEEGASSPGFSPECGLSFTSQADFQAALDEFLKQYDSFTPRAYALSRFTEELSAKQFLGIINRAS